MATKTDVRAERRRRISSREGDRMALITGRLRNLPPSPPPSPSSPPFFHHYAHQRGHSHTGINPSFFAKDTHKNPDSGPLSQNHGILLFLFSSFMSCFSSSQSHPDVSHFEIPLFYFSFSVPSSFRCPDLYLPRNFDLEPKFIN